MKTFILLLLACATLSACNIAGADDPALAALEAADTKHANESTQALTLLNSNGNSGWSVVKTFADQGDYAVFKAPDGTFHAFDVASLTTNETRDQLVAANTSYQSLQYSLYTYQSWEITSEETVTATSCSAVGTGTIASCNQVSSDATTGVTTYNLTIDNYGWVTNTEDRYTDPTSGLVFDIGNTGTKDLEAVAATMNKVQVDQVRSNLIASYGLSEDRAQQLATLASSWQNISKTRAMTQKDLTEFQVKALGTDLNTISAAAKKSANGDAKDYNALLQKAAQLNDISPEQARTIINTLM